MVRNALLSLALIVAATSPALANKLVRTGDTVEVADSAMQVTVQRDWNKLNQRRGKYTETWTQDGELLNDVTFYARVPDGKPLIKEVSKRRKPLPHFRASMLITDVPGLLESTYRIARGVSIFEMAEPEPARLAGQRGLRFTYAFVGPDELRRKGEAQATIIDGKLYMVAYEAPALFYYDRYLADFRALAASTTFGK